MQILRRRILPRAPVATTETKAPTQGALRFAAGSRIEARKKIEVQLKLIAESERQIDDAQVQIARAHEDIEQLLRAAKLDSHTDGIRIAELIEKFTRQGRTIDAKKFKAKVPADTFWACIDVSITRAGENLSQKELDSISEVVPSRSTGYHLVVREVKAKKGK